MSRSGGIGAALRTVYRTGGVPEDLSDILMESEQAKAEVREARAVRQEAQDELASILDAMVSPRPR